MPVLKSLDAYGGLRQRRTPALQLFALGGLRLSKLSFSFSALEMSGFFLVPFVQ
ncbi:MAG: hypothetical protein KME40_07440 [Komarekiella atlantica HA4396-MV6]|nr:hypothetical protein [Komarekiella atlantica HA4396-MV6]